ncbi:MAG: hypothetical protein GY934_17900, partial [Gammaproteobacteria bacterium]|nr:hypothetical protein [Gammaproteobacteria bacterium]
MYSERLNNNFFVGTRPHLRLLSSWQIRVLHDASLEVLERTGVRIRLPEAVDLLASSGAMVEDKDRVKIPSYMVEEALRTAPGRITISDRNGKPAMSLKGHSSYYGTGPTTRFVYDVYTGERRLTDREDIEKAAVICDYLQNIDFVMTMGMTGGVHPASKEVNQEITDRYDFEAMLTHTTKPLIFSCWTLEGLKDIYEMGVAVRGSEQILRQNPFIIAFTQPNTPL